MADESMADESMADEFKVEESMADKTIPWHMAYIRTYMYMYIHKLRNIEISEKKRHEEHLGHDVRHGYKYIRI